VPSGTRPSRHLRVRIYAGVNLARKDIFGARSAIVLVYSFVCLCDSCVDYSENLNIVFLLFVHIRHSLYS